MINRLEELGKVIGVVTEISDDKSISFLINNNVKCNISDIVAIESTNKKCILAQVIEIKVGFYLENPNQYLISKAADNNAHKLSEPGVKPRYGLFIKAIILGQYEISSNQFTEIKKAINRYTPRILQQVFLLEFENVKEIYGLSDDSAQNVAKSPKYISLGTLSYPVNSPKNLNLFLNPSVFKKHTLITGVTGSGKSRLAALLIRELSKIGAHVSILDPHNEYLGLLSNISEYKIYQINRTNQITQIHNNVNATAISFYEGKINPTILSKILPSLSPQQIIVLYEIFDQLEDAPFNSQKFIDKIIIELKTELLLENLNNKNKLVDLQKDTERFKDEITRTDFYLTGIKKILSDSKLGRLHVLLAIAIKINELRDNNLLSKSIPNWLNNAPHTIDIFNIDYSSNEYVRRFINSILQYFLREVNKDSHRIFVIDEAHMLLNENSETSHLIKQLLREARKFNLTVIFISQNIKDIPADIYTQFQNKFIFRESNFEETKFYPDQICSVSLFGAKALFSMKVNDIYSVSEIE